VDQVLSVLESVHVSVPPQKFTLPPVVSVDSGITALLRCLINPDATFIQSALSDQSADGIYLRVSEWGTHCPVAYAQTHELVRGNFNLSVIFQGKIYILSTPDALNKFHINPNKYLTFLAPHPPPPTPIKVVVLGPPVSGKSTHARALAQYYGKLSSLFF
jgi:YHS domain-containing protein